MKEIAIFSGNSNPDLAKEVCESLGTLLGKAIIGTFSDGEINVQIDENVRGRDVFVIQPTCAPVNSNLMELFLMADALKRASAGKVTAVMPYYGYARQDRKSRPRVPISASIIADLLSATGVDRVLTMDLHADQIQGFFNIPVDHLYSAPVLSDYIKDKYTNDMVVVSPDAGGVARARAFAKKLNASLAIIDKRRKKENVSEVMNVIGDVDGKNAILFDDMIDTAGTITNAAAAIKKKGAKKVIAACAHAVLSGPALDRINKSELEEVVTTNTIPLKDKQEQCEKLTVISVAKLLGEAIRSIHNETSISVLFEDKKQ